VVAGDSGGLSWCLGIVMWRWVGASTHQKLIDEMIDKIYRRKNSYGSILVKGCAFKEGDAWVNSVTRILPLHKSDNYTASDDLVYRKFLLFEAAISSRDLIGIIDQVPEKGENAVRIGRWDVKVKVDFFADGYVFDSGDEYLDVGWYFEKYQYRSSSANIPSGQLASKDLPFFPDSWTAIKVHTGLDITRHPDLQGIVICLPRYDVRIIEVIVGSEYVKVKVEPKDLAVGDIMGKVYCEHEQEMKNIDLSFAGDVGTAVLGFKPSTLYIALVSQRDNEVLDFRRYVSGWGPQPRDFVIEIPQYELREWIKNGENETVEYKADIGQPEGFTESVTAFANTKGGVLLLGVDDHSNIVGLRKRNYEDSITKVLRSYSEPQVKYDVKRTEIDGKEIIVMRVNEGENKPYVVKDRGVYVRAGGTDRIATRYEMDEMRKETRSPHSSHL
jgi:hypothetical protein